MIDGTVVAIGAPEKRPPAVGPTRTFADLLERRAEGAGKRPSKHKPFSALALSLIRGPHLGCSCNAPRMKK